MEEFKNLEAIIDLCRKELYTGDRNIHATLGFEELKELQRLLDERRVLERSTGILINKTREQKRTIQGNHILLAKYSQKNEEQEKIIELMAKEINDGMFFDSKEEVIEYFKNKARDEK